MKNASNRGGILRRLQRRVHLKRCSQIFFRFRTFVHGRGHDCGMQPHRRVRRHSHHGQPEVLDGVLVVAGQMLDPADGVEDFRMIRTVGE